MIMTVAMGGRERSRHDHGSLVAGSWRGKSETARPAHSPLTASPRPHFLRFPHAQTGQSTHRSVSKQRKVNMIMGVAAVGDGAASLKPPGLPTARSRPARAPTSYGFLTPKPNKAHTEA